MVEGLWLMMDDGLVVDDGLMVRSGLETMRALGMVGNVLELVDRWK